MLLFSKGPCSLQSLEAGRGFSGAASLILYSFGVRKRHTDRPPYTSPDQAAAHRQGWSKTPRWLSQPVKWGPPPHDLPLLLPVANIPISPLLPSTFPLLLCPSAAIQGVKGEGAAVVARQRWAPCTHLLDKAITSVSLPDGPALPYPQTRMTQASESSQKKQNCGSTPFQKPGTLRVCPPLCSHINTALSYPDPLMQSQADLGLLLKPSHLLPSHTFPSTTWSEIQPTLPLCPPYCHYSSLWLPPPHVCWFG